MHNIIRIFQLLVALIPLIFLESHLEFTKAALMSCALFLIFFKDYEHTAAILAGEFLLFTIFVELLDNFVVAEVTATLFFYMLTFILLITTLRAIKYTFTKK